MRELQLKPEHVALLRSRRVVVVVVQSALPNGTSTITERAFEHRKVAIAIEGRSLVGVNAGCTENEAGMLSGDLPRARGGGQRLSDADNGASTGGSSTHNYIFAIGIEGRIGEMRVTVDEVNHSVPENS